MKKSKSLNSNLALEMYIFIVQFIVLSHNKRCTVTFYPTYFFSTYYFSENANMRLID